ncbi:hypothetical protein L7F22_068424 [Adiantum nelumboides]|nr:hypothetical protein [Adiantum nelumboides]
MLMMSQGGDLFSPSDTLVMSDFTNLTEFDDFHKDLFLGNAMEAIAEGDLLEEDNLKLCMSEVTDAFNTSLKSRGDDEMDSTKARDTPFGLFIDEETAGSLQFMDTASQLDSPAVSDDMNIKEMVLSHTISSSSTGSRVQDGLPSHAALVAANELNCMSLDVTPVNPKTPMCRLLASPSTQAMSLASSSKLPPSSVASLLPPGKAAVDTTMFKMEGQSALCSPDMVASSTQVKSAGSSSSSATAFGKSDGGTLFNMVLRGGERCSIPQLKGALAQSASVITRDGNIMGGAFGSSNPIQGQVTHVPSMQRSQSSHALGQFRMSHCLGAHADDVRTQTVCKQEVPMSSASGVSLYAPYQTSSVQGLSGRPPSSSSPIRRVYSTGDLQGFNGMQTYYGIKAESSIPEEAAGVRIGHYTAEERRMKVHRYRQKRNERNFNKKIKYACRKTLADNRPRVRGRFARSDEMGDSGFRGSDIDEYKEPVTSHHTRMVRDQQAYLLANNSCIMSSAPIAQFWNSVGMKVAM